MMKKGLKLLILFGFLIFLPFIKVEAASTYTVEMVANQTGNKVIGKYNSYSAALNAMNAQSSNANSVATIYRDGIPVDSKYGIFKFKPGSTYNLYESVDGKYLTFIEEWKDEKAIESHNNSEHFKAIVPKLGELTSGDKDVILYKEVK